MDVRNLQGIDLNILLVALICAVCLWVIYAQRRPVQKYKKMRAELAREKRRQEWTATYKVERREPQAVKVELHTAPEAPHLEGVDLQESPAVCYERWYDSAQCDPAELGFPGNFATRGPNDLSRRHYEVAQRLKQIKSGEWMSGDPGDEQIY